MHTRGRVLLELYRSTSIDLLGEFRFRVVGGVYPAGENLKPCELPPLSVGCGGDRVAAAAAATARGGGTVKHLS